MPFQPCTSSILQKKQTTSKSIIFSSNSKKSKLICKLFHSLSSNVFKPSTFCNLFKNIFPFLKKVHHEETHPSLQGSKGAHNKHSESFLSLVKNDLFNLHHPWKHANQRGPRLPKVPKNPFPSCLLYRQYFLKHPNHNLLKWNHFYSQNVIT